MSTVTAFLVIKFYWTRTLLSKSLSAQRAKESVAGTTCTDTEMGYYGVLRVSWRFHAMVPLGVWMMAMKVGKDLMMKNLEFYQKEFRFHSVELGIQRCFQTEA